MHFFRRPVVFLVVAAIALPASLTFARKQSPTPQAAMPEQKRALHALNRLTFGPRPGEVDRVMAMGVDKWIESQLHPSSIDDSALEARLAPLRTLKMSTEAMLEAFPPQPVIKAVADGKLPMPRDPEEHAVYQAQLERYRAAQNRKADPDQGAGNPNQMTEAQRQENKDERRQATSGVDELIALTPPQRFDALLQMDDANRQALGRLPLPKREALLAGFTPRQRETAVALVNPQQVVTSELQQGKLLRALYSQRQLEEVMTDFWFNHFNVFMGKGADRYLLTSYERDVIRPLALGKFKDLLIATAKSPAMLFYLDNWMSAGPNSEFARYGPRQPNQPRPMGRVRIRCGWLGCGPAAGAGARMPNGGAPGNPGAQAKAQKQQSGLNENYARELLELHTLGVNGGYTQADVTEVAKVFTGWTMKQPRRGGEFDFNEWRHEPGTKIVLGRRIKEHGEREGLQVLEMLANSPATARFISTKLAQRFVADDPPPGLIDAMAKSFHNSGGDIREVLRTMFHSPEFWSPETYRAKVKTPLEFVVSAARASGAEVQDPTALLQWLNRMGMPLYGAQPPTGYSMTAETWLNSARAAQPPEFRARGGRGTYARRDGRSRTDPDGVRRRRTSRA